jgi:hypothetical protein
MLGFISGPLSTTSVVSATVEVFALALVLIAAGIAIIGIGLAFLETIILPLILGVLGGALLCSAPFFGIYYVSSNWLYRTFQIKRPVKTITIVWNYALGTLLLSIIGMMLAPIIVYGNIMDLMSNGVMITLSVVGGIVYLMALIIIPLKAYLADLVYVKAAMQLRDKEKEEEKKEKQESEEKKVKKKPKEKKTSK